MSSDETEVLTTSVRLMMAERLWTGRNVNAPFTKILKQCTAVKRGYLYVNQPHDDKTNGSFYCWNGGIRPG